MKKIYIIQLTILFLLIEVCYNTCASGYPNCNSCSDSSCGTCADGYFSSTLNQGIQDSCITTFSKIVHHRYGGHIYEIVREVKNKSDAKTCATDKGGYLA